MTAVSLKLTRVDKGGCGSLMDGEMKGFANMVLEAMDGLSVWSDSGEKWDELADKFKNEGWCSR